MVYYGARTTAGELIIMSISDMEPTILQGPEKAEFLANAAIWAPLPDDFDSPSITEWLPKDELIDYLNTK